MGHPAVLLGVTTGLLVLLGLVMILSASSVTSFANYGSSFWFFRKQLMWVAIGLRRLLPDGAVRLSQAVAARACPR